MDTGLNFDFHENVFQASGDIFQRLENEIEYLPSEESKICIQGKQYLISRQIAAYGDSGLRYTFSGLTVIAKPWTLLLAEIKALVESLSGFDYNFVLINRYENGDAYIGYHKDDEEDLEKEYAICSLSFGQSRTMIFKQPNFDDVKVELKDNSLLVMKSPTNRNWSHGIPKQKKRTGVRINLTFRKLKSFTSMKRELEKEQSFNEAQSCKKVKSEQPKFKGIFTEDEIPNNVIPIGTSVFVVVNTFKGSVKVHVRRYKKYGETFYPTSEGITLNPGWIQWIMQREKVPERQQDLMDSSLFNEQIRITSTNFEHFTFSRVYSSTEGEITKSITLSALQWSQMLKKYNEIANIVFEYAKEETS